MQLVYGSTSGPAACITGIAEVYLGMNSESNKLQEYGFLNQHALPCKTPNYLTDIFKIILLYFCCEKSKCISKSCAL